MPMGLVYLIYFRDYYGVDASRFYSSIEPLFVSSSHEERNLEQLLPLLMW